MGGNLNDSLNMEFDLANLPEITNTVRTSEEWREQNKNNPLIINNTYSAGRLGYSEVEQKVLEYFDYKYWQAIKAGDIKEASRIKAEWDKTEQTILNNTQLSLDASGVIDPTPISDGTNAIISTLRGNYFEAGLSVISILPYAGDIIGKGGKLGLKYGDEIGSGIIKYGDEATKSFNKAPNFIVSPNGTAYPVPRGATGPKPVINPQGKKTGIAFTGGKGGANQQVDTIRVMDTTPSRGKSPEYPKGYIKYENKSKQGVDPYTGKTIPNSQSHHPIK